MSEENKMIYCTQCGSGNSATSKFCSNCGSKLEAAAEAKAEAAVEAAEAVEEVTEEKQAAQTEGVFSSEEVVSSKQEEMEIQYNPYYAASQTQYYDAPQSNETNKGGGNIGVAIASLVCGIISLLCCCFTLFSAVLAIAAVVLGVITLCFKYDGKGMAIAGIVTGGIGLVIVIFAIILSGTGAYDTVVYEFFDELYY